MQANVVKNAPYSRANPFHAKVIKNINLNGDGSNKETRHLELSLKGSGLTYEPGDALGIYPENDPELVNAIIEEMKWDPDATVTINKDETVTIKEALTKHLDITNLNRRVMRETAKLSDNADLKGIVEDSDKLAEYVYGRDLLDLLRDFGPWSASAQEIVSALGKLLPRLYSIASSIDAHPEEVHLTIGAVRYTAHGRERKGVCSVQCAERVSEGDTLPIFIQPNKKFFLPDGDTNIIMVGPGTGIAPFRSFIEDRAAKKASGKAWLFFGDQHEATDYLYKDELEQYVKDGVLSQVTTAFSRDSDKKVYVQHRMLEQSKEIFEWLENGAYFYVCGDKTYMARDVNNALIDIVEKEGGMSREDAEAYVDKMAKEGRYQRDVY